MTASGSIELVGIVALGRHGVLPEERERAQPFEVDVSLRLDLDAAATSDDLADTVDYGTLTEAIAAAVEQQSFQLIERLADHIAGICLAAGPVEGVEVKVRKLRPPIDVQIKTVGVTITRSAAS